MNKIDFYKEWYYKEDERKDSLNNSLNIPIGILTAILAGIYFIISKFNYKEEIEILKYIFIVLIGLVIIYWVICIFYLLKSYNDLYKGYSYKGFPHANFLNKEEENLKTYIEEYKEQLPKDITLEFLVQQNIENTLIECVDTNVYNNDRKSAYLHKSKIHLLNCIIVLFVVSILFTFNYINHGKEEIQKIEILNPSNMTNDERKPPPPPPREEPRVIKEDKQPTTRPTAPTPTPKTGN